jgi:S-adenosylmethionine-diacylglycerol 3-amino-3-carboxypropyl transferase
VNILYAQCWEDPEPLSEALSVSASDDVLSVASAGDNSLALLLEGPRTLTAVDFNPAQLHLLELKMASLTLDYEEFVGFLGARPAGDRLVTYRNIRRALSPGARAFWDEHRAAIRAGVIHCGRLERYLAGFRRWLLPMIHGRKLVAALLAAPTLGEQERLYREQWDCGRWRWFFRFFFSRPVMSRVGRPKAWFAQVNVRDVGRTLLERTHTGLTRVPTPGNYFLEYMLTGGYRDLESAPPYLRRANFATLRERAGRVKLVCGELGVCLAGARPGEFSCFNLSDVFEYMSPQQADATWRHLMRVSRPGSRLVYRTLFVRREPPLHPARQLRDLPVCTPARNPDRTFFYDRFVALQAS